MSTAEILTSPIINGTPSGNGLPSLTMLKGSGNGTNYTSTSTNFIAVDTGKLLTGIFIPRGWTLAITAKGGIFVSTAQTNVAVAVYDGSTAVDEQLIYPPAVDSVTQFCLSAIIRGDDAIHVIGIRYKTSNAANAVGLYNASISVAPKLLLNLCPAQ